MQVTLVRHLLVSATLIALLLPVAAPRVAVSGANLIPGFAYSAPFEDLKLKP
jgi:hypothetical protein